MVKSRKGTDGVCRLSKEGGRLYEERYFLCIAEAIAGKE